MRSDDTAILIFVALFFLGLFAWFVHEVVDRFKVRRLRKLNDWQWKAQVGRRLGEDVRQGFEVVIPAGPSPADRSPQSAETSPPPSAPASPAPPSPGAQLR